MLRDVCHMEYHNYSVAEKSIHSMNKFFWDTFSEVILSGLYLV